MHLRNAAARIILHAGAIVLLGFLPGSPASAQSWPDRPIRVIVPFPPGQTADIVTRSITEPLSAVLGRQLVVDNRPGAGTLVGTEMGAKARPDGYTFLAGGSSALAINPHLYTKSIGYDTLRDFAPITVIHNTIFVFCVHPTTAAKNAADLIALARKRPGELTYGSSGSGTPQHLAMALFTSRADVKITHVPYKGAVASLTDLMAGQIAVVAEGTPTVMPHVKAGRLRAIGVSSSERSPFMPEVGTMQEQGLKGYEVLGWTAFVAPAGTPAPVLDRLSVESIKIINSPEVKKRLHDWGLGALGLSRERSTQFIKTELVKWGEAVRISGAKLE